MTPPVVGLIHVPGADRSVALPNYATAGAAGADVRANLPDADRVSGIILAPGERALVPTGLAAEIPPGWEMQIRPRSGLALKQGLSLPNAPGTIDSDYRGEIGVIMINLGREPVTISHGDRIAQAVVSPVVQASFRLVDNLGESARGTDGYGSTGVT